MNIFLLPKIKFKNTQSYHAFSGLFRAKFGLLNRRLLKNDALKAC